MNNLLAPREPIPVLLVLHPQGEPIPSIEELCEGAPRIPLTYEQFKKKHGTPSEVLDRITAWVKREGLSFPDPDWREKAELSGAVKLSGSLDQLRSAFHVGDLVFTESDETRFVTHSQEPQLGDIRDLVLWVYGLSTPPLVQSAAERAPAADLQAAADTRRYLPRELARIYGYPPNEGEHQTQGLIELSGSFRRADLQHYFDAQGINPRIVEVNLGSPVFGFELANLEVTLDIELAASVCPGATTVVYNACSRDFSIRDYFEVFNAAVFDTKNRPTVLSTSWGFPEFVAGLRGQDPRYIVRKEVEEPFQLLFRKAALLGITICASSGDTGSLVPFVSHGTATGATLLPTTHFPSSSPLVLGCGGTSLDAEHDSIVREVVWNRLGEVLIVPSGRSNIMLPGGASGGGVSPLNDLPTYQADCGVPEVVVVTWKDGVTEVARRSRGRGVPDVAANADIATGYDIFFEGHPAVGGGTSAAAPMWAALITRINSARGKPAGFLNAILYQRQREWRNLCNTITEGSNGAYHASNALWNPCTGLGSPNGMGILDALNRAASPKV